MDEQTVAALLETKRSMGADFLRNTQRVRAFLSDFLPAQPGERRYAERQMLVSLLEAGVPQQLAARHPWSDAELAALAQRTAAALLLDAQVTHQGVRVWHFVTRAAPGATIDIHAILGAAAQAPRQQLNVAAAQPPAPQKTTPQLRPVPFLNPQITTPSLFDKELVSAAEWGDSAKVQRLLAAGADVDAKDKDGKRALMAAAAKGHAGIVKLLLAAGANVNILGHGNTALMAAAANGHAGIVKLLLAAGANVNIYCHGNNTALMEAVERGDTEIVKLLLDAGASANTRNRYRKVLIRAVIRGDTEIVKLLLTAGADVHAKNYKGETALMHAIVRGDTKIIQMLRDAGAHV